MADEMDHGGGLVSGRNLDALARYFSDFAEIHVVKLSPLYSVLARAVARDERMLAFAAQATPGQPAANLLFAAVHYVLRQDGAGDPLADYYPSLGGEAAATAGNPYGLFRDFVGRYRDQILRLLSTKITNTNEVGRCGVLIAGFAQVAKEAAEPLHLIEIGPSAGLNLCWDRYLYRFGEVRMGPPQASILIEPDLRGVVPPGLSGIVPRVASRTGLELNPVSIEDEDTLAWQLALVFPEHVDRAKRILEAFKVARDVRPTILAGDATELIGPVIDNLPTNGAICVYHSSATYQFPPASKKSLSDRLAKASRTRPIWRVASEWILGAGPDRGGDHSLGLGRYTNGERSYQHLGFCDPHGRWLEWSPTEPEETDRL